MQLIFKRMPRPGGEHGILVVFIQRLSPLLRLRPLGYCAAPTLMRRWKDSCTVRKDILPEGKSEEPFVPMGWNFQCSILTLRSLPGLLFCIWKLPAVHLFGRWWRQTLGEAGNKSVLMSSSWNLNNNWMISLRDASMCEKREHFFGRIDTWEQKGENYEVVLPKLQQLRIYKISRTGMLV